MRKSGTEDANITIGDDFPVIDALEQQWEPVPLLGNSGKCARCHRRINRDNEQWAVRGFQMELLCMKRLLPCKARIETQLRC